MKQQLQGTIEEQCAFLYDLAQDKMKAGNFAGALYALKEVARHKPDYRDVQTLLPQLRQRKAEQRRLILIGLGSGIAFASGALAAGVDNDLWVMACGLAGLVCGYGGYSLLKSGIFSRS